MKWLFILLPMFCLGQKVEIYHYGYGGIVKVFKKTNSMTVFCDSLARPFISYEVIDSVMSRYSKRLLESGNLTFPIKSAIVVGKVIKRQRGSLLVYIFVYEKVVYHNGLVELYKKPKKKNKLKIVDINLV
jgi:hypothetical protein